MKWLKKYMTPFEQDMFKDELDKDPDQNNPGIKYKWEF